MKKHILATLLATAGLVGMAQAQSSGTISFNGELTSSTCTIQNPGAGTPNFTVTLPKVGVDSLTAGTPSSATSPFQIGIGGGTCTAGTKVAIGFDSNAANTNGRITSTGTATNIDIQISHNGAVMDLLNQPEVPPQTIATAGDTVTFPFAAAYFPTGTPTVGTVIGRIGYTVTYP